MCATRLNPTSAVRDPASEGRGRGSTCVHRAPFGTKTLVIPSVERGTWVGGVPAQVRWTPARPGPSLDARDDKRVGWLRHLGKPHGRAFARPCGRLLLGAGQAAEAPPFPAAGVSGGFFAGVLGRL